MAHAMPQLEGVDHRFVKAGDMSFHVALAGEGDPVLLLHGWPQHWYSWRLLIPRLAPHHRVIAMDLRGFGWSDIAWTGFEMESMAADVERVLEALEIDRVRLVGHDWGAWIGYVLALERPDLVEQLVAMSVPPPWLRPTPLNVLGLARFHHMVTIATPFLGQQLVAKRYYVMRKLRRWARYRQSLGPAPKRIYARDLRASTRARASMLIYRTFLARELWPVLRGRYRGRRLEVPTLALYGRRDPLLQRSFFKGAETGAADLRVVELGKAGHLLPEERPKRLAEEILAFFGADERASAPEPVPVSEGS